jgi:hypothetical protein
VTFKFWELLKNASKVTLVPKNIFFLKILNLVQSFVECKVSLADGTSREMCRERVEAYPTKWSVSTSNQEEQADTVMTNVQV